MASVNNTLSSPQAPPYLQTPSSQTKPLTLTTLVLPERDAAAYREYSPAVTCVEAGVVGRKSSLVVLMTGGFGCSHKDRTWCWPADIVKMSLDNPQRLGFAVARCVDGAHEAHRPS